MRPDAESLLVLGLAAFYLKDCLLLLDPDEALLEARGRAMGAARWRVRFGAAGYELRGRHPVLCVPLAPHRPVWRLRWSMTGAGRADAAAGWDGAASPALRALRVWPWAIAAVLFGLVPATLVGGIGRAWLLPALGLAYALVGGALVHVHRRRAALGLDARAFRALAVDLLLCVPYAVNLVRRVSLAASPSNDGLATALRLLPADAQAEVRRACAERLRSRLELEPEGSPIAARLAESLRALEASGPSPAA